MKFLFFYVVPQVPVVPAVCKFRRLLFPTFVLPPQQNTFRGIINACYAWPIFTKVNSQFRYLLVLSTFSFRMHNLYFGLISIADYMYGETSCYEGSLYEGYILALVLFFNYQYMYLVPVFTK